MKKHTYEPLTKEEIKKEIRVGQMISKIKEEEKHLNNQKNIKII